MNVLLLYRDRDFDPQRKAPDNAEALSQDLGLPAIFDAMAAGDAFLHDMAQRALWSGLAADSDTIRYRQDILQDCLRHPAAIQELYRLALAAIESRKKTWFGVFSRYSSSILYGAVKMMEVLVEMLQALRTLAVANAGRFQSEGLTAFFSRIQNELDDEYFVRVRQHLKELHFRKGVLLSAELGIGNVGANYTLRKPHPEQRGWLARALAQGPPAYTLFIDDRDEAGAKALAEIKERGINRVAHALAQSADHILGFFAQLRAELAFYAGCLNLHARLTARDAPLCFPQPPPRGESRWSGRGLYDAGLALATGNRLVGNDLAADGQRLLVITGANEGGKSTFLRSLGLAQLMMQCGMFVPAESFCSNICDRIFTHYRRREDPTLRSGKLDEELARVSAIVDRLTPDSLILLNESFAATNEREGSEIAEQIVRGLSGKGARLVFVTHLYEFTRRWPPPPRQEYRGGIF